MDTYGTCGKGTEDLSFCLVFHAPEELLGGTVVFQEDTVAIRQELLGDCAA